MFSGRWIAPINHFEVLRIPKTATAAEIKAAYLALAKQCHPDVAVTEGGGDKAEQARRFQVISASYDVLKDDARRSEYLQTLSNLEVGGDEERAWARAGREYVQPMWHVPPSGYCIAFHTSLYECYLFVQCTALLCSGKARYGHRSNYNDVNEEFNRQAHKHTRRKGSDKGLHAFEHIVHPRNLFFLLPLGLLTYWGISTTVKSIKHEISSISQPSDHEKAAQVATSVSQTSKAAAPAGVVDAWFNSATNRWETPAPWLKEFHSAKKAKVDRRQVFQSKPP
jgi:DnaJ domain